LIKRPLEDPVSFDAPEKSARKKNKKVVAVITDD